MKGKEVPRAHYRRVNRGSLKAAFKGLVTVVMGPAGRGRFNSPRYPRDAQARDLERIGGDMYAAFDAFSQDSSRPASKTATDRMPGPASGATHSPVGVIEGLSQGVRTSVVDSAKFPVHLPPPTICRAYNEVLPSTAERILRMVEKERDHQIGREDEALHRASKQDRLVLWFGFSMTVFAVATAGFLAMKGHDLVAGIVGCTGIAAFAAILYHGRRGSKRFLA